MPLQWTILRGRPENSLGGTACPSPASLLGLISLYSPSCNYCCNHLELIWGTKRLIYSLNSRLWQQTIPSTWHTSPPHSLLLHLAHSYSYFRAQIR